MNPSPVRGVPLQMLGDAWPTNPHPDRPDEVAEMLLSGPPLQMLDPAVPASADEKLVFDLIARLGPDVMQQLIDDYRRTAARAG